MPPPNPARPPYKPKPRSQGHLGSSRPLGAGAEVFESILVGPSGVAECVVATVRKLTGDLERLRATHRPHLDGQVLLDRPCEREQSVILEELAIERDRAVVEQCPYYLDALLDPGQRLGPRPVDAVLGQQAKVA